jgi:hypothetical protein
VEVKLLVFGNALLDISEWFGPYSSRLTRFAIGEKPKCVPELIETSRKGKQNIDDEKVEPRTSS